MKKSICFLTGFLICLFSVLNYSNKVLAYKAPLGISQFEALHKQEKDCIEVLFVGTSHVYSDINPAVIWEKNKIASFNMATGDAGLWNSYYAIEEALKTQSPELIVLELYGALYEGEYKSERAIMDAHWGIKNLFTRWESLQVSAPKEDRLNYMLKFPYYHNRYKDIQKNDFEPYTHNYTYENKQFLSYPASHQEIYKGAVTLSHITPYEQLPDFPLVTDIEPISPKSELYLKKIIELANNKEIPLLFIVSPYMAYSETDHKKYNYIEQLAQKEQIEYVNFNQLLSELNLDPQTDFAETSHLSYLGMRKFSEFLGNYLSNHYDNFFDKQEEEKWESWNQYAEWENQVMHDFDLINIREMNEYISKLGNPHHFVILSFDNLSDEECQNITYVKSGNLRNMSGTLIIQESGKEWILNAQAESEKVHYQRLGSSDLVVNIKDGDSEIIVDRNSCKKVKQGVNIVVYDKYADVLVDAVGFDARKGFRAVR